MKKTHENINPIHINTDDLQIHMINQKLYGKAIFFPNSNSVQYQNLCFQMWIGFFFSFFFFLAGENLKKPMLFLHQYICSFKMLMYNSFSRNLIGCLVGDLPVTADFSSWVLILSSEDLIISGMRCSFSNSQSTFERKAFFWQTLPLLRIQQPLLLWLE